MCKSIIYSTPGDPLAKICTPVPWARFVAAVNGNVVDPPMPLDCVLRRSISADEMNGMNVEWAETDDEFLQRIINKDVPPNAENVRIVDSADIPSDRSKRAALLADLSYDAALFHAIMVKAVDAEMQRRWRGGFVYDFGDDRGKHLIGTTEDDMAGWSEVAAYAGGLADVGDTSTTIEIETNTGRVHVTAPEFKALMLEASRRQQRLKKQSFALQAMNPIPTDFADDSRWA